MKRNLSLAGYSLVAMGLFMGSCVSKRKFMEAQTSASQRYTADSTEWASRSTTMQQNLSSLEQRSTGYQRQLDSLRTASASYQRHWDNLQTSYTTSTEQIHQQIHTAIDQYVEASNVQSQNGRVYVNLPEKMLFNAGSSTLSTKGKQALDKLADVLAANDNIEVDIVATSAYYNGGTGTTGTGTSGAGTTGSGTTGSGTSGSETTGSGTTGTGQDNVTGSGTSGSGTTGSGTTGSGTTGSGSKKSGNKKSGKTGSGTSGSGTTGSGTTGSGTTGSGTTGSGTTGSDTTGTGTTGSEIAGSETTGTDTTGRGTAGAGNRNRNNNAAGRNNQSGNVGDSSYPGSGSVTNRNAQKGKSQSATRGRGTTAQKGSGVNRNHQGDQSMTFKSSTKGRSGSKATASTAPSWNLNVARSTAIVRELTQNGLSQARIVLAGQNAKGMTTNDWATTNRGYQIVVSPKVDFHQMMQQGQGTGTTGQGTTSMK